MSGESREALQRVQIDEFVSAALPPGDAPPSCQWREDEDGTWWSACGQGWQFIDAGPTENKCRFCHWCGGSVVPVPVVLVPAEENTK